MGTHDDTGLEYDELTQGAGLVNGLGAATLAFYADTSVPVGGYWLTTSLTATSVIGGETLLWSQQVIWGNRELSGAGVIDTNQTAWGSSVVWGVGALDENIVWGSWDGDNIVWGSNLVWGSTVEWSDNIVWGSNVVWDDNIVWGPNIVWGSDLLGTLFNDNIVWGSLDIDNIVWGSLADDNIVWGSDYELMGLTKLGGGLW